MQSNRTIWENRIRSLSWWYHSVCYDIIANAYFSRDCKIDATLHCKCTVCAWYNRWETHHQSLMSLFLNLSKANTLLTSHMKYTLTAGTWYICWLLESHTTICSSIQTLMFHMNTFDYMSSHRWKLTGFNTQRKKCSIKIKDRWKCVYDSKCQLKFRLSLSVSVTSDLGATFKNLPQKIRNDVYKPGGTGLSHIADQKTRGKNTIANKHGFWWIS